MSSSGGIRGSTAEVGRYDPDRPPATGLVAASSDEFVGGESALWRWGNQSGYSRSVAQDTMLIQGDVGAGTDLTFLWLDAPTAVDFSVSAKISAADFLPGYGVAVLSSGSEATPTRIDLVYMRHPATDQFNVRQASVNGYTGVLYTIYVDSPFFERMETVRWVYFQARYVAGSKSLSGYYSFNGFDWIPLSTQTLAVHPQAVGISHSTGVGALAAKGRVHWFRTLTSEVGAAGEVGS